MFYDVTIKSESNANLYGSNRRKINDIKALRELTRAPSDPNVNGLGACMGLTDAKNCIEMTYDSVNNTAIIRMTAEQYAAFEYNRQYNRTMDTPYDWWIDEVKPYFPTTSPVVFTY